MGTPWDADERQSPYQNWSVCDTQPILLCALLHPLQNAIRPKMLFLFTTPVICSYHSTKITYVKPHTQFIPFSPLGLFGPTMNHFLFGIEPPEPAQAQLHNIDQCRFPHAHKMATLSYSHNTPSNIIGQANNIWKTSKTNHHYGGSYKNHDPLTYYTQIFGREICFANGNAGLKALSILYNEHNGPLSKTPTIPKHPLSLSVIVTNHSPSHYSIVQMNHSCPLFHLTHYLQIALPRNPRAQQMNLRKTHHILTFCNTRILKVPFTSKHKYIQY